MENEFKNQTERIMSTFRLSVLEKVLLSDETVKKKYLGIMSEIRDNLDFPIPEESLKEADQKILLNSLFEAFDSHIQNVTSY